MAIITFGGRIGAGKSTVAPIIAKKLGYEEINMGAIFRGIAHERGIPIEEIYKLLESDPLFEKSVDGIQIALIKEKDNVVVQSRLAFFFAKQSGKPHVNILLTVDARASAERKAKEGSYLGKSADEIMAMNGAREDSERKRYRALYGIEDHLDPANFDIVCDTTNLSPDEVIEFLLKEIAKRK